MNTSLVPKICWLPPLLHLRASYGVFFTKYHTILRRLYGARPAAGKSYYKILTRSAYAWWALVMWHLSLSMPNNFNKTGAAIFPMQDTSSGHFLFHRLNWQLDVHWLHYLTRHCRRTCSLHIHIYVNKLDLSFD